MLGFKSKTFGSPKRGKKHDSLSPRGSPRSDPKRKVSTARVIP